MNAASRDSAEAAVLGAVLIADNALDILIEERLRPEHFARLQHEVVFSAMLSIKDAGGNVDALTLKARFDSPQSPVSMADIELLAASVVSLGSVRDYCRIVRESAWFDGARRALHEATEALERADRVELQAAVARIDQAEIRDRDVDPATEFLDWYEADIQGWPFPFDQLTEATGGGMFPGETSIVGSWSGFGKTFLLSQFLRRCRLAGAEVREYASEMHGPKRTARTLTSMTGIPSGRIQHKTLNGAEWTAVVDALKHLPYETQPTAGWRVEDYCHDIRRRKPDVAAIDTINNLPCSRIDEWDRAATMLADAAAQAGTHLIQVCQLNLERDKGKRPPPVARDLRFGGTFYARARVVMFLHRDQESTEAGDGEVIWRPGSDGHIRVDKSTHGDGDPAKGFLPVTFVPKWLRFEPLSSYSQQWAEAA